MPNEKTKKIKWARSLLIGLICLAALAIGFHFRAPRKTGSLRIHGSTLSITYARTELEKEKGLCCRTNLGTDQAMLFVYSTPGNYQYWMKDTRIPLDMLWLDSNKKVVHIEHSVQPSSYPKTYGSPTPARYVLETVAGYSKSHGLTTGDTAQFNQ